MAMGELISWSETRRSIQEKMSLYGERRKMSRLYSESGWVTLNITIVQETVSLTLLPSSQVTVVILKITHDED